MRYIIKQVVASVAVAIAVSPCHAQAPDYDFQWVTITDPGNRPYTGGPFGELAGRGSVSYEYRISRLELTSAQFLEFVNTFWQSNHVPISAWFIGSSGIIPGLQGPYQLNPNNPDSAMMPVIGLSWRTCAMYCNWLHNGKRSDLASLQNGAYDVSTFHTNLDGTFTDQQTHSPGAKFWIPTLDEWIKAAHYDPNRYGRGVGGWWDYPNGSNTPLIAGPPGFGQTSGGEFLGSTSVALGSYATVQSPWGLFDASGGASEWTEEIVYSDFGPERRVLDGRYAGISAAFAPDLDLLYGITWDVPNSGDQYGLRLASAVPEPGTSAIVLVAAYLVQRLRLSRRARDGWHEFSSND